MKIVRLVIALLTAALLAAPLHTLAAEYQPEPYQPGKDVI